MPARSRSTKVGREAPKYLLRLPDELRDFLKRESNINGRSMNSEIVTRLEASRRRGYRVEQSAAPEYSAMSETERSLFAVLKKLSPKKQLALLALLES